MKLNIGCGNHYAQGWTNVDVAYNDQVRPDIVADVTQGIPLPDGCAERIYVGHVLEHLDQADVVVALTECRRLLAPGGQMLVVGPDCDRADIMLRHRQLTAEEHRLVVEGAGRWASDVHLWRSTPELTAEAMRAAGFEVAESTVQHVSFDGSWPVVSAIGWQFAAFGSVKVEVAA
jgi:hypothetical protein